jgi:hypothetical protein
MARVLSRDSVRYQLPADGLGTASVCENGGLDLAEVVIPAALDLDWGRFPVVAVGPCAFRGNAAVCSVRFAADSVVRSIGALAFQHSAVARLELPAALCAVHARAFRDAPCLREVAVRGGAAFFVRDGVLYAAAGSRLLLVPRCWAGAFVVPAWVAAVGPYAFQGCRSLTSVSIPASVTSIGDYAFDSCRNLRSVSIAVGVTTIGDSAFSGCKSLTSVSIPDSVSSIEVQAFWGCGSLETVSLSRKTKFASDSFPKTANLVYRD